MKFQPFLLAKRLFFFKLRDDSNSNLNVDSLLFQPYNLNSISFYMILVFEKGSFKNGFMRKVKDR